MRIMDIKEFVAIPDFPMYNINKYGEVFSEKSQRIIKIHTDNSRNYPYVCLFKNNKQYNILIHRLLALVFLGLPSLDSDLEVDHKDTNIFNYDLDNLQVLDKNTHLSKTLKDRGQQEHFTKETVCKTCGKVLSDYRNKQCKSCYLKKVTKEVTIESIEYWVLNHSWVRAGKELGLSDNGLRKKYKSLTGKDPKELKRTKSIT